MLFSGVAGVPSIDEHGVIRQVTEEVSIDIEMEALTLTASDSQTAKTGRYLLKNICYILR